MYRVKSTSVADIPVIQELTERIWKPTYKSILEPAQIDYMIDMMYSTASLTKQLTELNHKFIVLQDNKRPIGYASYSPTDTEGVYKLHKIYLDPSYQGKGVGRFFLDTVCRQVKNLGATILELDVNRYNKARFFYEKMGFSTYDEKDTDIGNGYVMEDYVMRKTL
ncbi:GNAT family N-acetyltransferase [Chitinophaga qingshengii]|uniref:GNAT family N-acetyltransferase n=1 Tax=Chitinophaga qingshengii TaxID=1569794 RepID=A0ABR7TKX7_9BACT|nr:GNAT family N-acetyltransferase [Chitinophaga qingshengii]MBC9930310.1 GNAT family N-acetyltransferase [Chitinophaga qingshengii]